MHLLWCKWFSEINNEYFCMKYFYNSWNIICNKRSNTIWSCPVSWGCRIQGLLLCRGVRPPLPNKCPIYDTKQSEFEGPVIQKLWGMQSTYSLPLLPLREAASDRVLCMGQIELHSELLPNWIIWNRTVFDIYVNCFDI